MDNHQCIFCFPITSDLKIVWKSNLFFITKNPHAMSPGHLLLAPYRHVESFFQLKEKEINHLLKGVFFAKELIEKFTCPKGYNIGVNIGETAGQTIKHTHIHVVPKYWEDESGKSPFNS